MNRKTFLSTLGAIFAAPFAVRAKEKPKEYNFGGAGIHPVVNIPTGTRDLKPEDFIISPNLKMNHFKKNSDTEYEFIIE